MPLPLYRDQVFQSSFSRSKSISDMFTLTRLLRTPNIPELKHTSHDPSITRFHPFPAHSFLTCIITVILNQALTAKCQALLRELDNTKYSWQHKLLFKHPPFKSKHHDIRIASYMHKQSARDRGGIVRLKPWHISAQDLRCHENPLFICIGGELRTFYLKVHIGL